MSEEIAGEYSQAAVGRHRDKVVLVTGAGAGMGRAMCERFVLEGALVVAVDITGAEKDVAASLGGAAVAAHADVSSASDIEAAVGLAVETFGGLDVVCNNAGISRPPTSFADVDDDAYDHVMNVNARGVFLGTKYGARAILASRRSGGAIVNTASTASIRSLPGRAPYGASKGAVAMLTQVAALDFAAHNIRVNAICPGTTKTGMFESAIKNIPGVEKKMADVTPLGRACEPSEIASVASFLASDDASYITGALIPVDGGISARQPG